MIFNEHSKLDGKHAFLGASRYHWINYSENKLASVFKNFQATQRGTQLHALAESLITFNITVSEKPDAFNMFVNDAIRFKMKPEVLLFYSDHAFGTADAISFRNNILQIHDLKTGISKASMTQLEVYAALFCLEYSPDLSEISIVLRIYQGDSIMEHKPSVADIAYIMQRIQHFSDLLSQLSEDMEG